MMKNRCQAESVQSFNQAIRWVQQDLVQRGQLEPNTPLRIFVLLRDPINTFLLLLRLKEWTVNAHVFFFIRIVISLLFRFYSLRLCYSIPPNVFGPGFAPIHYGPIVVNGETRVGENCRCHIGVNIGASGYLKTALIDEQTAPIIGKNCYIGPGAKIYGPIHLADGIAIGANAVVNKSCSTGSVTLAGIPATIISEKGSDGMIVGTSLKSNE